MDYTLAVTDRSQADMLRFAELRDKSWQNMSAEEKAEWLAGSKACYNFSDMNRVGGFVEDLNMQLLEIGNRAYVIPKTDWQMEDIPSEEQLDTYLNNVIALKNVMDTDSAALPDTMNNLTLDFANAIEDVCVKLNSAIQRVKGSIFYSGDVFSGEI